MSLAAYESFADPEPAATVAFPRRRATAQDVTMRIDPAWRARSGDDLGGEAVRLRIVGNPYGEAVLVLGGISAGAEVTSQDGGWWQELAGPGRVLDTDRFRIIGADLPPHGRHGPKDLCPEDFARLLRAALREAGISRLYAFVGASFGGMIGLAFARLYPELVGRLAVVCAGHRPSPMASAVRHVQRQIMALTEGSNREADGVALARQLAMTTYRCAEEFDTRFAPGSGESVVSYLEHHGRRYADTVPAARFSTLSAAIDAHDEDPAAIGAPVTLIAADTDRLVPLSITHELAARLPNLARYEVIRSRYGHDAFLKESAAVGAALRGCLP